MPKLVNTAILKSPVNWVKVFLMAVFAFTAFFLISDAIMRPDRMD